MRISRRGFIGGAPALLVGCAPRRAVIQTPSAVPRLAPVKVARDRVIRTVAGLRPFRPSGFVVRAEKMGEKLVIHNYGHGGAGITLSWGTSLLAVDLAPRSEARDCAVIGCGVVGLSTARLLQLRGYRTVIYTRDMPPATTSNVAGGLWEPVSLYDPDRVTPEFRQQYGTAARMAHQRYQSLVGQRYGVRWLPLYRLSETAIQPPTADNPASDIESLYPETRQLGARENPFSMPHVQVRYSMLIEPATYLQTLVDDFALAGGRVVIRDFQSVNQLFALPESLIFNCTGLGARALFNDSELTPIKGQLAFLLPQPEVDYMTLGPSGTYMFPRHDGILLGGSFERGIDNTEVVPEIITRILKDNAAVFGAMRA